LALRRYDTSETRSSLRSSLSSPRSSPKLRRSFLETRCINRSFLDRTCWVRLSSPFFHSFSLRIEECPTSPPSSVSSPSSLPVGSVSSKPELHERPHSSGFSSISLPTESCVPDSSVRRSMVSPFPLFCSVFAAIASLFSLHRCYSDLTADAHHFLFFFSAWVGLRPRVCAFVRHLSSFSSFGALCPLSFFPYSANLLFRAGAVMDFNPPVSSVLIRHDIRSLVIFSVPPVRSNACSDFLFKHVLRGTFCFPFDLPATGIPFTFSFSFLRLPS